MTTQQIAEDAKRLWPTAIVQADLGLEARGFSLEVVKVVKGRDIERAVLRARSEAGADFIFKYEPNIAGTDRFRSTFAAHQRAREWFARDADLHLADILWSSEELGAQIIQFIPGQSAFTRLEWALDDVAARHETIERCAAWLGRLHEAGENALGEEPRLAKMDWVAKRARRSANQVREGTLEVCAPKQFLGLCAMIHRLARAARDQPLRRCYLHGDPHFGNFIFGPDGLYGIDVTDRGVGPVEIDVARILTRAFYSFPDASAETGFAGLSDGDWGSFAHGYGRDCRGSPMMALFVANQILNDWMIIHPDHLVTRPVRKQRFEKLKAIFHAMRDSGY